MKFQLELPTIYKKIVNLVIQTDKQHWGILDEVEEEQHTQRGMDDDGGGGSMKRMTARCIEYHEYGKHARQVCGPHIDTGSLFTIDIMLSKPSSSKSTEVASTATVAAGGVIKGDDGDSKDDGDFQGGHFITENIREEEECNFDESFSPSSDFPCAAVKTTVVDEDGKEEKDEDGNSYQQQQQQPTKTKLKAKSSCSKYYMKHKFEQGDALLFISHKKHFVTPIIGSGSTRKVLVLEFWLSNTQCNKFHRCMNNKSCASM